MAQSDYTEQHSMPPWRGREPTQIEMMEHSELVEHFVALEGQRGPEAAKARQAIRGELESRVPALAEEIRQLRERLESTQRMLDLLSGDQVPLEKRMREAEAKARVAQKVAADIVTEFLLPVHTRSPYTPGDWRHSVAAIATGSWDALLPDTGNEA